LNLVTAAPLWLLAVLGCAMIAAAIEDAMRLRISNITSLVVLAGAVIAAVIEGPSWMLWQNGAVFAVFLVLGTIAFSARWLGGGDVKLFAAGGLWFDFGSAMWFAALALLAGGIVAIGFLVSRLFRKTDESRNSARVPYGIAIALGALAMVWLEAGVFHQHQRSLPPIPTLRHHP
jgi:prepilin peptidase CpaA